MTVENVNLILQEETNNGGLDGQLSYIRRGLNLINKLFGPRPGDLGFNSGRAFVDEVVDPKPAHRSRSDRFIASLPAPH